MLDMFVARWQCVWFLVVLVVVVVVVVASCCCCNDVDDKSTTMRTANFPHGESFEDFKTFPAGQSFCPSTVYQQIVM
jgi:hypothetical protein